MATETSDATPAESPEGRLTHCPTCGMKINRDDLSLCSYCGAPVQLGEQKARISAIQKRLGKMPEHKNYEAALAWQPPESELYVAGIRDKSIGRWLTFGFFITASWASYSLSKDGAWIVPALLSVVFGVLALKRFARAKQRCAEATSMPLLRRVAIVHERRSETTYRGATGKTAYFFQIEFADGGKGEFRQPGKGSQFEPLVNGNTGIAYTRGQELLDFKVLRV